MSLCGFDKDGDLCFSSVYGPRAAVAMPSQTCRHLRLDKQTVGGKREADIINVSASSRPTSSTLSGPINANCGPSL